MLWICFSRFRLILAQWYILKSCIHSLMVIWAASVSVSMSTSFGWSRIFILLLIRSQTSLAVARATCSQLTARPASPPTKSLSAGAGTPVLRTATVRTTAMPTAPVRSCKTDNHSSEQNRTITLSGSEISLNDSTQHLSMMFSLVITDS